MEAGVVAFKVALILKEISAIHKDNKHFRETVASLNMDGISYNRRIENLTIRVEKLETKKAIKIPEIFKVSVKISMAKTEKTIFKI